MRSGKVFSQAYVAFFVFNIITSWWVYYASFSGVIMEVVLNSLFMATVFWLFHVAKRYLGPREGTVALIIYWLGFEYLHLFWDFSYPWLNFGNAFANQPYLIQWYEYTGTSGGTLWILVMNVLIAKLWIRKDYSDMPIQKQMRTIYLAAAVLLIPAIASVIRYATYEESGETIEVVAVQPNIDPYNEKFGGNFKEQLDKMLALGEAKLTDNTDYLIFPETALQEPAAAWIDGDELVLEGLWESKLHDSESVKKLREFMLGHPKLKIVVGMTSKRLYPKGVQGSETARKLGESGHYYDYYNAAMYLDDTDSLQVYYKSKPLIGVERMPFTWLMKHFEDLIWSMGGTTGSIGVQDDREVFTSAGVKSKVGSIICYESVFGEFIGDWVLNGANALFIVTNDGWWEDTPGHRQHNAYAALRAIEHRRGIARSANTGISSFINQRGDISQETAWWVPDAINGTVTLNEEVTFYTQHGDYLSRTAFFLSFMLWLYAFVVRIRKRQGMLED